MPRDVSVEEALQLRTYQDGLAGKRMAIREVLRWILKREKWLSEIGRKRTTSVGRVPIRNTIDPVNADAALLLLGIADHDPDRQGPSFSNDRAQLLLEPWAVNAALRRRRGVRSFTAENIDTIRRGMRNDGTVKLPKGIDP